MLRNVVGGRWGDVIIPQKNAFLNKGYGSTLLAFRGGCLDVKFAGNIVT